MQLGAKQLGMALQLQRIAETHETSKSEHLLIIDTACGAGDPNVDAPVHQCTSHTERVAAGGYGHQEIKASMAGLAYSERQNGWPGSHRLGRL
jgi:hypothetical protein